MLVKVPKILRFIANIYVYFTIRYSLVFEVLPTRERFFHINPSMAETVLPLGRLIQPRCSHLFYSILLTIFYHFGNLMEASLYLIICGNWTSQEITSAAWEGNIFFRKPVIILYWYRFLLHWTNYPKIDKGLAS